MKKGFFVVLIAAVLAGCGTTGGNREIADQNKVSTIKEGKTTMKEVRATLGEPNHVDLEKGGDQVWTYQNISTGLLGYIPFVNLTDNYTQEKKVVIRFNKKGVVEAIARSGGNF